MNIKQILALATQFESKAQDNAYDSGLRNQLVNTPPSGAQFSFRQVAGVVLTDLTVLDRNEADPQVTAASHAILDILNSLTVPSTSAMLNAATQAANIIRTKIPNEPKKIQVANYLVTIVNMLINKSSTVKPTSQVPANESPVSFLQRLYRTLKKNQPINEDDQSKWEASKGLYVRRLNGLNSLPDRTPQQEQERSLIQFVNYKV